MQMRWSLRMDVSAEWDHSLLENTYSYSDREQPPYSISIPMGHICFAFRFPPGDLQICSWLWFKLVIFTTVRLGHLHIIMDHTTSQASQRRSCGFSVGGGMNHNYRYAVAMWLFSNFSLLGRGAVAPLAVVVTVSSSIYAINQRVKWKSILDGMGWDGIKSSEALW